MPVEVCQVSSEIIVDVTKTISSPTQASIYEYMLNFTYDGFHKHALRFTFHFSWTTWRSFAWSYTLALKNHAILDPWFLIVFPFPVCLLNQQLFIFKFCLGLQNTISCVLESWIWSHFVFSGVCCNGDNTWNDLFYSQYMWYVWRQGHIGQMMF
jgi:hypothetical protein